MPVALGNRLVFPWPRRVIRPDSASKPTTTGMMRSRWPRDARPVRGSASYPARGRPPLRHLLPGHRSDRPRHPETRTSQRIVDLGEPLSSPRRIGGLEHHLPGKPGGSLSARQSHRYDTGQPERNGHPLTVRRFEAQPLAARRRSGPCLLQPMRYPANKTASRAGPISNVTLIAVVFRQERQPEVPPLYAA